MTKKTKRARSAVGYIRMSSDKQEESPEQQRDEILKLATKHGYKIIRWYEDHAISGVSVCCYSKEKFAMTHRDCWPTGDSDDGRSKNNYRHPKTNAARHHNARLPVSRPNRPTCEKRSRLPIPRRCGPLWRP